MTTIGLIRHGITEWNNLGKAQGASDISLNELGRKQAYNVGGRLLEEVGKRGIEFIEEIVHTYNGKRILIISHGALIGLTLK